MCSPPWVYVTVVYMCVCLWMELTCPRVYMCDHVYTVATCLFLCVHRIVLLSRALWLYVNVLCACVVTHVLACMPTHASLSPTACQRQQNLHVFMAPSGQGTAGDRGSAPVLSQTTGHCHEPPEHGLAPEGPWSTVSWNRIVGSGLGAPCQGCSGGKHEADSSHD